MTQPKTFWTTPKKIALTVVLAVMVWLAFGCSQPSEKFFQHAIPATANGETDAAYLQHMYAIFNDQYFHNRLTQTPVINTELTGDDMAETVCNNNDGTACKMSFNLHFTASPRVAEGVMLHEMCHVKVWPSHIYVGDFPPASGSEFYHDRVWRACMLSLDTQGAFRVINIDYYQEKM